MNVIFFNTRCEMKFVGASVDAFQVYERGELFTIHSASVIYE